MTEPGNTAEKTSASQRKDHELTGAERVTLMELIHQTFGHSRFTQDSPIRPDVWMAYWAWLASGDCTDPKIDIIITPKDGVPAGQVAIAIELNLQSRDVAAKDLDAHLRHVRAGTRLSYSRSTVQADLTFPELLVAVVPLTSWWQTQRNTIRPEEDTLTATGREGQPGEPETAELGDLVLGRIHRFMAAQAAENDSDTVARITINDAIRDRNASFQLYRFAALASLTATWRQAVLAAGADPAQVIAARENAFRTARSIIKPDALLVKLLDDLGVGLTAVLQLIDTGTRRLASPQPRSGKGHNHNLDLAAVKIFAVSANRDAQSTVARSRKTIKADAAGNVFDIDTRGIIWGVIDSGIDIRHPAFLRQSAILETRSLHRLGGEWLVPSRVLLTYDFTYIRDLLATGEHPGPAPELGAEDRAALRDDLSQDCQALSLLAKPKQRRRLIERLTPQGKILQSRWDTYVRAVRKNLAPTLRQIGERRAAGLPLDWSLVGPLIEIPHTNEHYRPPHHEHGTHVAGILAADWRDAGQGNHVESLDETGLVGICPGLELYDLRAFDAAGNGREDVLIFALEFIRHVNRASTQQVVNGVNLSLAVAHDVQAFACGQTPVCQACNDLVLSGVVVVVAAGNQGYEGNPALASLGQNARDISITDPGNADLVITVGATHREKAHTYGVSYFSSRGPTADGRMKPDLVAPGEKIVGPVPFADLIVPNPAEAALKRLDGTSMAAPHVSGVAAMLMARHRELIGQPQRIKEILCRTATDLGRLPAFQGSGLVDALRALQSI